MANGTGAMKSYPEYLALLGGSDAPQLTLRDARHLAGAMLDQGVPEIELGALIGTINANPGSPLLLEGFVDALAERIQRWPAGAERHAPVAIGCYGGAWDAPNLLPLIAVLLARLGIPVIMHGPLHAHAGVSSAILLRALGVMPCAQLHQASAALAHRRIAFLPDALIAPGLALLIALRARVGPTALFTLAARLIDPFAADALIVAAADDAWEFEMLRRLVAARGRRALLLGCAREGRTARWERRPRIEFWCEGRGEILFEEDAIRVCEAFAVPDPASADSTAQWMRHIVDGARPMPIALLGQFAACLYATGYCEDISQAKALAAIGAARQRVA